MNSSLRRRGRAVSRVDSHPDRAALTGPAAWFVRFAGLNGILCPLGFGAFTIPAIVSVAQGHGVLYTFGNPTYSADRFGVVTTVPLLAAFLVACLVQLTGAGLLIWLRPSGFAVLAAGMLLMTRIHRGDSYVSTVPGSLGVGVRKSDGELLARINAALDKLTRDGTVKNILAKWGLD